MNHKEISPYLWQENPMEALQERWGLLSAGNEAGGNTMTVSWGGVGVLWNKPVVFAFVRPQRHTLQFLNENESFSLSFFQKGAYREELAFCGKASGRDVDKFAHCNFTTSLVDGCLTIDQADTILCCKKLFVQRFTPESFLSDSLREKNYPNQDYHYQFIGEITKLLVKESLPQTPKRKDLF